MKGSTEQNKAIVILGNYSADVNVFVLTLEKAPHSHPDVFLGEGVCFHKGSRYILVLEILQINFQKKERWDWKKRKFGDILYLMKKEREEPMEEYKFHYHFGDAVGSSDKYFLAHDIDKAKEMFEYSFEKRSVQPEVTKVEQWNRWKASWEVIDHSVADPSRN